MGANPPLSESELLAKVADLTKRLAEAEDAVRAAARPAAGGGPDRKERLAELGSRTEGLAHDLNNVFAPILMAAALLKDKVSDEKGTRMLTVLESNAERGAALVRQIQGFAVEGTPLPSVAEARKTVGTLSPFREPRVRDGQGSSPPGC
jgi:signal transduction histidine kinase